MRAINLLPKQAVRGGRSGLVGYLPFVGSGAVPVIALILIIVGYSSGSSVVSTKRGELATVNAEVAKLAPAVSATSAQPTSSPTAGLVTERAARLAALQLVLANEVAWDTTLLDVARVLPANVWLTSLTVTSPTPADTPVAVAVAPVTSTDSTTTTSSSTPAAPAAPAVAPVGFTINGTTYTENDVAAVLQRLQLLPILTNVTLASTTRADVGTKKLFQFQVTAAIQPASAQSQP